MIKGVNRKIIEVADTGNKYFERAILFVNPQFTEPREVEKQARKYISTATPPSGTMTRQQIVRARKMKKIIKLILAGLSVGLFLLCSYLMSRIF